MRIRLHAKESEAAHRLTAVTGIGPITASAVVATIGNARDFRNGRQMAAWAGLVPRQSSSGGKERLGSITRRGDRYLRALLTQGSRSTLQSALIRAPEKRSRLEQWIVDLRHRVGYHKTLVAIANKHARICWAILAKRGVLRSTGLAAKRSRRLNRSLSRHSLSDAQTDRQRGQTEHGENLANKPAGTHRMRSIVACGLRRQTNEDTVRDLYLGPDDSKYPSNKAA
jgi:Transposase IS116/IS110/IS902 family